MTVGTIYRFLFGTLRGRLIVGVALVHAVMMTLFVCDATVRQRALLLERQTEQATALSQALATTAAGWIAADDIAGLQELVDAQGRYPELLFAMLTDGQGRVLAHTDHSRRGLYLRDLPRGERQSVFSRSAALVDVATPALVGGRQVGWARVGIGQQSARKKLAQITRSGVQYAMAAIVVGSLIAWIMGRRITRRLYGIQATIDQIRAGNRLARSSITGSDEAAMMAREFNFMLDAVAQRDAELRESEKQYRGLIQKIQAAVVVHGGDTRILASNPVAQRLLGLTQEQMMGKTANDPAWHFSREDGARLELEAYPVNRVLATREPQRDLVMGIHRPATGDRVWVLVNADPVFGEPGELTQVIVTFVDITERKQAEEALYRLNRELRAISNCNQILVRAEEEQTLLREICRIVCDEAGYRIAWVGYAENDEAKNVRPVAWAGVAEEYLARAGITWSETERGRGPTGMAIRSGKSAFILDFEVDPQAAPWRENALKHGYRSSIALPLKDENENPFGALTIHAGEPNAFTEDETRLLEKLAEDLAFGIMVLRARTERRSAEESLQKLTAELEQRVAERTDQLEEKNAALERMNKIFVGRELRMVELKEKIKELELEQVRVKEVGRCS